jgi:hypothetical protein
MAKKQIKAPELTTAKEIEAEAELSKYMALAAQLFAKDEHSAYELGKALWQVRKLMKDLGKGNWGSWLNENSIPRNRANYCIEKFRKEEDGKPKPKKPAAYTPTVQPTLAFSEMLKAAADGDTDEVKVIANRLRTEINSMEAAIEYYMKLAKERAAARQAKLDSIKVQPFRAMAANAS